jgi:allantoin racemase
LTLEGENVRRHIKIVYPSAFDIPGAKQTGKPKEELLAVKDPDTEVVQRRAPDAFVHFVEQAYEADLTAVQHARDAWKAEQEGDVDAICINCNVEPGVKAARELCDTLVLGPACAVLHVASMLGRRFSYVISGGEGEISHAREALLTAAEHYGLAHKIASIREVDVSPLGFNEELLSDAELEHLKEVALAEAKTAIYQDGAEVIIGYGGPKLNTHLVENLKPLGVPVVSPTPTLLKVAEMLVRLGLTHSKRTYPKPRQVYDFTVENVRITRLER